MKERERADGGLVEGWVQKLNQRFNQTKTKNSKSDPTPKVSMFILKMIVNGILNSMEVVLSPNSIVYEK